MKYDVAQEVREKMSKGFDEFCTAFAHAIVISDDSAKFDAYTALKDLDEWDSLGKFSFAALAFSNYNVNPDAKAVNDAATVGDLWRLIETQSIQQ
jgi:hypothetical protein